MGPGVLAIRELGRRGEESAGLAAVDGLERVEVDGRPSEISHLAAEELVGPPAHRERPDRVARLVELGQRGERLGQERVAGEDGERLAERDVHGRLAASQIVVAMPGGRRDQG